MALQKQYVDIPVGVAGIEQSVDPMIMEVPKLAEAANIDIDKIGALVRRAGYVLDASLANVAKVVWREGNKVEIGSSGNVYKEWSPTGSSTINTTPVCRATSDLLLELAGSDLRYVDACVLNSKLYVVADCYLQGAPSASIIRVFVFDLTTRALKKSVLGTEVFGLAVAMPGAADCKRARILVCNNRVCVLCVVSHYVYMRRINTSDNGFDYAYQASDVTLNASSDYGWDACSYGEYIWLAYYSSTDTVRIHQLDENANRIATTEESDYSIPVAAALTAYPTISVSHDNVSTTPASATIHIAYGPTFNGSKFVSSVYPASLGARIGIDLISDYGVVLCYMYGATSAYDATLGVYVVAGYIKNNTSLIEHLHFGHVSRTTGAVSNKSYCARQSLLHKMTPGPYVGVTPMGDSEHIEAAITLGYLSYYDPGTATTRYVYLPAARYNTPETVNSYPLAECRTIGNSIPAVIVVGTTRYFLTLVRTLQRYLPFGSTDWRYRIGIALNSWTPEVALNAVSVKLTGSEVLTSGALPSVWTHIGLCGIGGSLDRPYVLSSEIVVGSGGLSTGTYRWKVIHETTHGNTVYRSQPSDAVTLVAAATDAGRFHVRKALSKHTMNPSIGSVGADVQTRAVLYRTLVGGSEYYRVPMEEILTSYNDYTTSSIANDYVEFTDITTDAVLATQNKLYTAGGILENYPCPPSVDLEAHQERIWAIDGETGDLYYSKYRFPSEGYAFNPQLVITNPRGLSNKPVALKSLSWNALLVFYSDAVWYVVGDGPADNGTGGNYALMELSPTVGCYSIKSIIKTNHGVFFLSGDGVYLIPLGLGVPQGPISDAVRDIIATVRGNVIAVNEIKGRHQIRWVTSTRYIIVYNYLYNMWYYWRVVYPSYSDTINDAYVKDENHYITSLDANGREFKQNTLSPFWYDYYLSDDYFSHSFSTPWIKLSGLLGYKRIWKAQILLENTSVDERYSLGVAIYSDYSSDPSLIETLSFTDTELHGTRPMVVEIGIKNQKCSAIKFGFTIGKFGSYALANIKIKGIRLEYGVEPGSHRGPRLKS